MLQFGFAVAFPFRASVSLCLPFSFPASSVLGQVSRFASTESAAVHLSEALQLQFTSLFALSFCGLGFSRQFAFGLSNLLMIVIIAFPVSSYSCSCSSYSAFQLQALLLDC